MKRKFLSAVFAALLCLQLLPYAQAFDYQPLTLTDEGSYLEWEEKEVHWKWTVTFSQARVERKTVTVEEDIEDGIRSATWEVNLVILAPGSSITVDNQMPVAEYIGHDALSGDYGSVIGKDRFGYSAAGDVSPRISSGVVDWPATYMCPLFIERTVSNYFIVMESVFTTGRFDDVPEESPFFSAVNWAVEQGITLGTGAAAFSPGNLCTHNHILTFLWRSQGSIDYYGATPFGDGDGDFVRAARWAYQKEMVDASYNGQSPCTRAQAVTYLWILAGRPSVSGSTFPDVPADAFYSDAVAWAVSRNITNGFSDGTFRPDAVCSRGQIVAFLYRAYA